MDAGATGVLARACDETSQGELRCAGLDRGVKPLAIAKSDKVIITCAITGGIHTPTMSDALPITPDEIASQAIAAAQAGAAILHLHARDPKDGRPSPDPA